MFQVFDYSAPDTGIMGVFLICVVSYVQLQCSCLQLQGSRHR